MSQTDKRFDPDRARFVVRLVYHEPERRHMQSYATNDPDAPGGPPTCWGVYENMDDGRQLSCSDHPRQSEAAAEAWRLNRLAEAEPGELCYVRRADLLRLLQCEAVARHLVADNND